MRQYIERALVYHAITLVNDKLTWKYVYTTPLKMWSTLISMEHIGSYTRAYQFTSHQLCMGLAQCVIENALLPRCEKPKNGSQTFFTDLKSIVDHDSGPPGSPRASHGGDMCGFRTWPDVTIRGVFQEIA